jgi:membrane-associated protease RseP (regulator of RpoE activity)
LIATSLGRAPAATLRVLSTEVQGSWSIGELIPGVGRVDQIHATSIEVLDDSGQRGVLSLYESKAGDHVAGAATPKPDAPADPFADRIRKLADSSYEVDRQLVRDLVGGTTQSGGVRAFPIMKDKEVAGLRLAGVRPGSVAAALGMRSGDVIAAVDGETIKNMQQLLDLYGKLDRLDAVELSGTRAGKPLALTLRLR